MTADFFTCLIFAIFWWKWKVSKVKGRQGQKLWFIQYYSVKFDSDRKDAQKALLLSGQRPRWEWKLCDNLAVFFTGQEASEGHLLCLDAAQQIQEQLSGWKLDDEQRQNPKDVTHSQAGKFHSEQRV